MPEPLRHDSPIDPPSVDRGPVHQASLEVGSIVKDSLRNCLTSNNCRVMQSKEYAYVALPAMGTTHTIGPVPSANRVDEQFHSPGNRGA